MDTSRLTGAIQFISIANLRDADFARQRKQNITPEIGFWHVCRQTHERKSHRPDKKVITAPSI
jgi:hypothetical protein